MKNSNLRKIFLLTSAVTIISASTANAQIFSYINDLGKELFAQEKTVEPNINPADYTKRRTINKRSSSITTQNAPVELGIESEDILNIEPATNAQMEELQRSVMADAQAVKENFSKMPPKKKVQANVLKLPDGYMDKKAAELEKQLAQEEKKAKQELPKLADASQQKQLEDIKQELAETKEVEEVEEIKEAKPAAVEETEITDLDTSDTVEVIIEDMDAAETASVEEIQETQKAPESGLKHLSLKDALKLVFENNEQLKSARQNIKLMDESLTQAYGDFRPNASISYGIGKERVRSAFIASDTYNQENRSLDVTQPIFRGGGTLAAVQTASSFLDAAVFEYRQIEQQIFFELISNYFNIIQAQSVVEFAVQNELRLKRNLEASEIRFKAGDITLTDVEQSRARTAVAMTERIEAENALRNLHSAFERITGVLPEQLKFDEQIPLTPENIGEAFDIAMANNPQLKRLEALSEARKSEYFEEITDLLPEIDLVASVSESHSKNTFFGEQDNRSIMLQFSVPLYQSGNEYSRIRAADATKNQAKMDLRFEKKRIRENLSISWNNFLDATARMQSSQIAFNAAKIALEGVSKEEELGARTVLDTLDAQQELFDAQTNLAAANRDKMVAIYEVQTNLGQLNAANLGIVSDEAYIDDMISSLFRRYSGF